MKILVTALIALTTLSVWADRLADIKQFHQQLNFVAANFGYVGTLENKNSFRSDYSKKLHAMIGTARKLQKDYHARFKEMNLPKYALEVDRANRYRKPTKAVGDVVFDKTDCVNAVFKLRSYSFKIMEIELSRAAESDKDKTTEDSKTTEDKKAPDTITYRKKTYSRKQLQAALAEKRCEIIRACTLNGTMDKTAIKQFIYTLSPDDQQKLDRLEGKYAEHGYDPKAPRTAAMLELHGSLLLGETADFPDKELLRAARRLDLLK